MHAPVRTILGLMVVVWSAPALPGDAASEAAAAACDRMRTCAMEQVQTMPSEYRAMMEANLNHLCDALPWAQYQSATGVSGPLRKPFIACMDSIATASCADLDADQGSPACEDLQQRADAYLGEGAEQGVALPSPGVRAYTACMTDTFDYAACQSALTALGRGGDAAEFHGSLSGALCVLPPDQIDLLRLLDAGVPAGARAPDLLKQLRDRTQAALQDEEMGFTPLLPSDELPLSARVEALAAWCAGFLFGLSTKAGFQLDQLSADAQEVIDDFAEFTRAGHEEDADGELEESAYAELVEYVRVGTQLVYMDLRPQPIPDPSDSQRVH